MVRLVDEVQYKLDDGPCPQAMRDGHMVRIDDTAEKAGWPEFEAQAASYGIRSCLAMPLNADGQPVGALNLYARAASAFGAAEARRAGEFRGKCLGRADAGHKACLARCPYRAIAFVADFADGN